MTPNKLSSSTLAIGMGVFLFVWAMLTSLSSSLIEFTLPSSLSKAQNVNLSHSIPITGKEVVNRYPNDEIIETPTPTADVANISGLTENVTSADVVSTNTAAFTKEMPWTLTEFEEANTSIPTTEAANTSAAEMTPTPSPASDGVTWSVEVQVPASNQVLSQMGGVNGAEHHLETMIETNVSDDKVQSSVEVQNVYSGGAIFKVTLQGEDGISQLKETLYEDLANQINIINGPSIIEITGEVVQGQEWPLKLHANPSTGYLWKVITSDSEYLQVISESELDSNNGIGNPEQQIIRFRGLRNGVTTLKLAYIRPWEQNVQYKNKITVQSQQPLSEVQDLSDPAVSSVSIELTTMPLIGETTTSTTTLGEGGNLGLPASFNWVTQGKVTSVKDQGACGSCWAFGTVGVMESAILLTGGPTTDLSEQYLINCNDYGYSCNGGWWAHDFHWNRYIYPQTQPGAVLESELPYTASNGSCSRAYNHPYRLASWSMIAGYSLPTVEQLKNAIYAYGPIAVAVCVGNAFQAYRSGIFATNECTQVNHAVILTGWDDANQYWIMKNSWGTGWGENGYMRIRWGTSNIGYAASYVVYSSPTPTVTPGGPTLTPTTTPTRTNTPIATNNDDFNNAINVVLNNNNYTALQFTNNATVANDDPIFPCTWHKGYNTVWYRYVAPNSNLVILDTKGSNFDTILGIWRGTRGALTNVACNDDTYGYISEIATSLVAGQTYYIEVAGYYSYSYGLLQLNITATGPTITPTPTLTHTPTPTFTYTPTPPLPPSPRLIAPSGIVTNTNTPDYQWAEVTDALEYYLEVYKSSSVLPISTSVSPAYCTMGVCTYPGVKLTNGTYQFRVKARNQTGWGPFSAWRVFVISYSQPSLPPPTLIAPNGVINTATPTFQWNEVNGAESYDLQVTSTLTGSTVIFQRVNRTNCSNAICSFTANSPLLKGTYAFRVRSINEQGRAGTYSLPMYFRVNASNLTTPTNLTIEQTATNRPLFRWNTVSGATRYYLLVYWDNNGTYPLRTYVNSSSCNSQVCSYRSSRNLAQGNYRCKIRAYDGREWSDYSEWKAFAVP